MTKKKDIEVVVHYPENQAECEQKIRESIAEWYAEIVKSELDQEKTGAYILEKSEFASTRQ